MAAILNHGGARVSGAFINREGSPWGEEKRGGSGAGACFTGFVLAGRLQGKGTARGAWTAVLWRQCRPCRGWHSSTEPPGKFLEH